jgi:alcohol dehydrogenase (cytochrome c)
MALGLFLLVAMPVRAADPEIDRLLQAPVTKDWVTNGGNLTNQRYSLQKQIDTTNVKQLKGAWMTRPQRLRARRQIFVRGDAAR